MKLYIHIPEDCEADDMGLVVHGERLREATPAEIMACHPVCAQCKHWANASDGAIRCFNEESRVHLDRTDETDYCNKWEAK
jgi:hypothetical protein